MVILKLSPTPPFLQCEQIRQLIGFYGGIGSCSEMGVVVIQKKESFNYEGLFSTLTSIGYNVRDLSKLEG